MGARYVAKYGRITHVIPFISSIVVESDEPIKVQSGIVSVSRVAKVDVSLQKVKRYLLPKRPFGLSGKGVRIAVIDTGLSPHVDLLLPDRVPIFVDVVAGKSTPYDDNGHGTAICGAIAGNGILSNGKYSSLAPLSEIIPIKAIGSTGEGNTADILQAMQWVWDNCEKYNIRIVCASFGAEPQNKDPLVLGVEALHKKGILVVASSGNDGVGKDKVKSPGISPYAITVGGIDENKNIAEFTSRGLCRGIYKPDIYAPAQNVVCPSMAGDYAPVTGTSIATPIVASVCANIIEKHPSFTPDKVKEILLKNSVILENDYRYRALNLEFLSTL